ncbi:uncharacterized protein LOC134835241 [Culicoides brevitarsis]|uniref:uncharacterized protein LOC134835241 n=1 Tax=Culicoides brevitarsis TaxID=469753 RepID=UPI00307C5EFF
MKIFLVLSILPLVAYSIPIEKSSQDAFDLSNVDISDDQTRTKRSGFDIGALKQNILGSVGQASAGAIGGLSSSSGKAFGASSGPAPAPATGFDHYGPPSATGHGFDGGDLKRNILNTLFQAVKAISGGIVGLKGQLIKGSGYLVSAKGKLIASSGDQVSGLGNKIAHSATLVPAGPSHGSSGKGQLFSLSGGLSGGSSSSGHSDGGSGDFLGSLTKLSGASSSKGASSHDEHSPSFTSFETHAEGPDHTNFNVHTYTAAEPTFVPHHSYGPPQVTGSVQASYSSVHH